MLFSKAVVLLMQHAMQLLHTTAAALDIDISASALQHLLLRLVSKSVDTAAVQHLLLGLVSRHSSRA